MFGSDIIDAAIGLFLVYFLFSVLCSALNEWIVGHLRGLRAKGLENGIERLLAGADLKQEFYDLPLVKCLAAEDAKPSYISSDLFVDALLTLVKKKAKAADPNLDEVALDKAAKDLDQLLGIIRDKLKGVSVQPLLLSLLSGAKDIDEAHKKLEAWFDEGMERASGWYKKQVQVWTAALALGTVVFFNADTLTISRELLNNDRLRATLVASAEAAVKDSSASPTPGSASNSVASVQAKIKELGLPIGWAWHTNTINDGTNSTAIQRTLLRQGEDWTTKIGGLLVTACAVSLGAPFWFELLGKLINLRSSGKKPQTGEEKDTKDD